MSIFRIASFLLFLTAILGGCASITTTLEVAPATAPNALVEQVPMRLGVYFSKEFRQAQPEAGTLPGKQYQPEWRFQIGRALESTFREVLRQQFAEVIEIHDFPAASSTDLGVDAVIVPIVPEMTDHVSAEAIFGRHTLILVCRVDLYRRNGELLAQWVVAGRVSNVSATSTSSHQELLRHFAASLIHSFVREPARSALGVGGRRETTGDIALAMSDSPRNYISLRLNAESRRGDSIEEKYSGCLDMDSWPTHVSERLDAPTLRAATFPWFEPMQLSEGRGAIERVLRIPLLQTRLSSLGVSYLVLYNVKEYRWSNRGGGCFGGPGAGGCIGYSEAKTVHRVDGEVWDVRAIRAIDVLEFSTESNRGVIAALILPIPYGSGKQSKSCEELRMQIKNSIDASRSQ